MIIKKKLIKNLNSNKKIIVFGSAIIDMIVGINKLPKSGEDILGVQKEIVVGGCAYNVSSILNYLNIDHDLFVPVGKGVYADIVKKQLQRDGHKLFVEDDSEDNGWCLSFVEEEGERTFVTFSGIDVNWKYKWFKNLNIKEYDYIYLSGYQFEGTSGEIILKVLENRKKTCTIIFDPGPRCNYIDKNLLKKLLSNNTILELNKRELILLSGEEDIYKASEKLYNITQNAVITTLGEEGTLCYTSEISEIIPTEKVNVVDTIGAGDSHTAAFIAGIASNLSLQESCMLGNKVAGKVVENIGCKIVD